MASTRPSSSPTTLAGLSPRWQRWRPWSIPIDLTYMRRNLCGLLNKLTKTNFEPISDRIVRLAVSVERTDDDDILDAFVQQIFSRGILDSIHVDLCASLCQKIMDDLEAERSLWRRVDLFHLGNPMKCFETSLRLLSQYEFDRLVDSGFHCRGDWDRIATFSEFVGELLVGGVLLSNDVTAILDFLFHNAPLASPDPDGSGEYAVAICRFLHPILKAFNAFALLEPLAVVARLEYVLQDGSHLSLKARFMLMNILDQVMYPRPQDVFSSTRQRVEVYGLDPEDSDFDSYPASEVNAITPSGSSISQMCQEHAKTFLRTLELDPVEELYQQLKSQDRRFLIAGLVSEALQNGDASDASFVGSAFLDDAFRDVGGHDKDQFVLGFESVISTLEDIVLDAPHAYSNMAIMLHGSPLSHYDVEEMVNGVDSLAAGGRRRLLDAYSTLHAGSHSRVQSGQEDTGDEQYGSDSLVSVS